MKRNEIEVKTQEKLITFHFNSCFFLQILKKKNMASVFDNALLPLLCCQAQSELIKPGGDVFANCHKSEKERVWCYLEAA